jgi:hypothetical protein
LSTFLVDNSVDEFSSQAKSLGFQPRDRFWGKT